MSLELHLILWTVDKCRDKDFSINILLQTWHWTCLGARGGGEGGAVSDGVGREEGGPALLLVLLGSHLNTSLSSSSTGVGHRELDFSEDFLLETLDRRLILLTSVTGVITSPGLK